MYNEEIKFPENRINKMLFGVWCGEFPKDLIKYPKGWEEHSKNGWKVVLFINKYSSSNKLNPLPSWIEIRLVPQKYYFEIPDLKELSETRKEMFSDIVRLLILRDEGGVYCDIGDVDIKCSPNDSTGFIYLSKKYRLKKDHNYCILSKDGLSGRLSNSTIISPANNKFIINWIEEFKKLNKNEKKSEMIMINLMKKLVDKNTDDNSFICLSYDILQGRLWHDDEGFEHPNAMVVHHSSVTWAPKDSWIYWSRRLFFSLLKAGISKSDILKAYKIMWESEYKD